MSLKSMIGENIHSEDIQEIISPAPSWLLKRGISFVLLTLVLIFGLSAVIRYPEILTNRMTIMTENNPTVVINRVSGNLIAIHVKEGDQVEAGDVLAYIESIADHEQVLQLLNTLTQLRSNHHLDPGKLNELMSPKNLKLGELQASYQNFYQAYLNYRSVKDGGISLKRRQILTKEIENIQQQNIRIKRSYQLQKKEIELAQKEFEKYTILAERQIISPMELQRQEAAFLTKLQALPHSENTILNNQAASLARSKELAELDNEISEEQKKFVQAMNRLISDVEFWKQQYILSAPRKGKVIYASTLQKNQYLNQNEIIFYISPENSDYFGEMYLPQHDFGRIKIGQSVLIKVRSYPYEEYGFIRGQVAFISDIPVRDSVFLSKVEIYWTPHDSAIKLRPGILADADVITDDQTILYRIWKNIVKSLKKS